MRAIVHRRVSCIGVKMALNTRPFNFTRHPALSVPCGKSFGLPIGMQWVGRDYDDPVPYEPPTLASTP